MRRVAILGGGPAGLAAAQAALAYGATVVVLDEGERIGGQFWRHHETLTDARLQHQWGRFERLRDALDRATVHTNASVWRIETDGGICVHALIGPADASDRDGKEPTNVWKPSRGSMLMSPSRAAANGGAGAGERSSSTASNEEKHDEFRSECGLRFPLVADDGAELTKALGLFKDYGEYGWFAARVTYLLDADSVVQKVWDVEDAGAHPEEVLAAVQA